MDWKKVFSFCFSFSFSRSSSLSPSLSSSLPNCFGMSQKCARSKARRRSSTCSRESWNWVVSRQMPTPLP